MNSNSEPVNVDEVKYSLLDLLISFARRKRFIFTMTLAMGLLGLIVALVMPRRYKAETTILPPSQDSSIASAFMTQASVASSLLGNSLAMKSAADMQIAMLKSRTVEDSVIDSLRIMDEYHLRTHAAARRKLEKIVTIEGDSKAGMITISASDHNPRRAADLANGYVAEYARFNASLALTEAGKRRLFFEREVANAKDNLAKAEENFRAFQQKSGVIASELQGRGIIESAAQIHAQIVAKQVQIQGLSSYASADNPDLKIAQQELNALRAKAHDMGADSDSDLDALMLPHGKFQNVDVEYLRAERDVKFAEAVYELLTKQYEIAKIDEAKQGALVQVVDAAVPPETPYMPRLPLFVAAGLFLGFFCGMAGAILFNALERLHSMPQEFARFQTLCALLLPSRFAKKAQG